MATLLFSGVAISQIPVEIFGGHKKTTLDILFFKFIKSDEGENSKFLFFNRNRASLDYQMTANNNLPSFGFTEAISYNHPKLKGVAPVAVAQLLNSGFTPKGGIQFAHLKKDWMVFTWIVTETKKAPTIDFFLLGRYTPKISNKLNLFSQIECLNALPTEGSKNMIFIQRIRLGLKYKATQFGIGTDFSQMGRDSFTKTNNWGIFLRYEF